MAERETSGKRERRRKRGEERESEWRNTVRS
jgi:hypothetical protein